MSSIPVRIMEFNLNKADVENTPRSFAILLGTSMTLPYLEPYIIRSMKSALKEVRDPVIVEQMKQFIGQEAQHFRQHMKLNDFVRELSPEMTAITRIETAIEADYQRFSKTKSLRFNLAYAEGFESITSAVIRVLFEMGLVDKLVSDKNTSDIARLFQWHMLEEVEHKSVTFNALEHLYGSYFYRCVVGAYAQYHFFSYVFRFSRFIKANKPGKKTNRSQLNKSRQPNPLNKKFAVKVLVNIFKSYSPFYDPNKIEIDTSVKHLSRELSKKAVEIREPTTTGSTTILAKEPS